MIPLKDCVGEDVKVGDFVIYVVQGNRNAGINFGYVLNLKDNRKTITRKDGRQHVTGEITVKIQRANAEGERFNAEVVDVKSHWREDTPPAIINYNHGYGATNAISSDTYQAAWREYWVPTTYKDSGKPSTTMIRCTGGNEHRLLVTEPR